MLCHILDEQQLIRKEQSQHPKMDNHLQIRIASIEAIPVNKTPSAFFQNSRTNILNHP